MRASQSCFRGYMEAVRTRELPYKLYVFPKGLFEEIALRLRGYEQVGLWQLWTHEKHLNPSFGTGRQIQK